MGAGKRKVFSKILLPLSIPGIISGITMVFVPAVSTFIISKMLGGGSNILIGDLIEMQFLGNSYRFCHFIGFNDTDINIYRNNE